jgi:hypothetical protein
MNIDNKRARGWIFVHNNYTEDDIKFFEKLAEECKYLVFGKEVGESKTPHLQGYVEFANARSGKSMKKLHNGKTHWEVRVGTPVQAASYCKKGEQSHDEWDDKGIKGENYGKCAIIFEKGKLPKQGTRTDLDDVADLIIEGASTKEVAHTFPTTYIKYHKGIEALKSKMFDARSVKPKVIWRWGLTGTGKTRGAFESHNSCYIKDGTQWWDGYEQQDAIIIDDFDGRWPFRDLLRLLDHYPYQGQFKGGYIHINSPIIYITCDRLPAMLGYPEAELSQLLRRIDEIIEVVAENNTPTA